MLSVRLMTYMHANFIRDAMDGIMMQKTDFKIEVVVGDDFSTDGTLDIIRTYSDTENIQIKILERKKGGVYWQKRQELGRLYNFTNILENCTGKYIALLDGDDDWTDPLKLQKQVDFLEENEDFVGVFHNTACIDERQLNPKLEPWRTYDRDIFTARDTIRQLSLFHTSSYCFQNLDFNFSLIVNPKISSGDMMLLGLISKYGKLKLLDKIMSVYRKNDGGVTSSESLIKYHTNRINLAKTLNHYFENKFQQRADQVIEFHKEQLSKLKFPYGFKLWRKIKAKLFNI
jgi:glycosyltransferase involved in cell wall biosynthesis